MFIIYVFNTFCKNKSSQKKFMSLKWLKEFEKEPKIFIDHSYKNVRIPYNEIIFISYSYKYEETFF